MGDHVPRQIRTSSEGFFTLSALIWHLARMDAHVLCQTMTSREGFVTLSAFKWLLASMDAHVLCQSMTLREGFLTLSALKWHLASMDAHVLCQTMTLREGTLTLSAFKWLLASMGADVHFQFIASTEEISTMIAFKWLLAKMSAQMLNQSPFRFAVPSAFSARIPIGPREVLGSGILGSRDLLAAGQRVLAGRLLVNTLLIVVGVPWSKAGRRRIIWGPGRVVRCLRDDRGRAPLLRYRRQGLV